MSHRHRGQLTGPRSDGSAREAIEYAADAGLRWAHEDHLAATDHHPGIGDLDPVVLINPDCRDGKHHACSGDGWNTTDDMPADCPCLCHAPGGWGER